MGEEKENTNNKKYKENYNQKQTEAIIQKEIFHSK
jgi:hypothetical protein